MDGWASAANEGDKCGKLLGVARVAGSSQRTNPLWLALSANNLVSAILPATPVMLPRDVPFRSPEHATTVLLSIEYVPHGVYV